jgi:hypothetical protein
MNENPPSIFSCLRLCVNCVAINTEAEAGWIAVEWLAFGRCVEEPELIEAQDTLVDPVQSSGPPARAGVPMGGSSRCGL